MWHGFAMLDASGTRTVTFRLRNAGPAVEDGVPDFGGRNSSRRCAGTARRDVSSAGMATGPMDVLNYLRLPGVAGIVASPRPAWLWNAQSGRIVFANAAGVSFFREPRLSALRAIRFDLRRPGLAPLNRAATTLPRDGSVRMARLRFFSGLRDMPLTCACRLLVADGEQTLVLVTAADGAGEDPRPLEQTAPILFDDMDTPLTIERAGEALYRNPAAQDLVSQRDAPSFALDETGALRLVVGATAPPEASIGANRPAPEAPAAQGATIQEAEMADSGNGARFSFRLDADGRFIEVGPALIDCIGPRGGDVVGRYWAEIADTLGLDPDGRVATGLRSREAWDNVRVVWPKDAGGTATLQLAAQPCLSDGRVFVGFAGFGEVISVTEPAAPPAVSPAPSDDAALREDRTAPAGDSSASEQPVIPPSGEGETEQRDLNHQERTAFRAIAEALGARRPAARDGALETAVSVSSEGDTTEREEDMADAALVAEEKAAAEDRAGDAFGGDDVNMEDPGEAQTGVAPADAAASAAAILDSLPYGIAIVREERILHANRAFLDVFDYADTDDLEVAGGLSALFEGPREDTVGATVLARRRDGSPVSIESRIGRMTWLDGRAMFVTAREIPASASEASRTDSPPPERDAENEIAELRAVLDTATDGVLVLSADGAVETVNRSAEALFGREAAEIVGRPFTDLVAEESRDALRDYLEALRAGGVMSVLNDGREIMARSNGGTVPLFLTVGRVGDGQPPRYCAVVRDLTDWKAAESDLVAARKRAEDASAQKSDFLAKMSHEIRTPLNAIIGFAEVILEERFGPIGNERYRDYVKDIRASGEHIMSLINDLLDLSKVEAGRLEMNFTGVRLNDIVEQSVAIMQPQANRERVIIRTSLARGLPAVMADARSLRQVMLNLLSNAVKFTQPGGQTIVSTAHTEGGEVLLRVRDTGIGMSEADMQTALEPFRQIAVRSEAEQQGTGLGLPLTRALVEANQAAFSISSRPDEGTLVEIRFPATRVLTG